MKKQLLILPFDHRGSFSKKLLGYDGELNDTQKAEILDLKKMIFSAFLSVYEKYENKDEFYILVDQDYGQEIIDLAKENGIKFMIPVEKSGQEEFDFNFEDFGEKIKEADPEYVKVLVRYSLDKKEVNKNQLEKLKVLSDFCVENNYKLLFELLAEESEMAQAITEIKEHVEVDIWKLPAVSNWDDVIKSAGIDIVVLGRGAGKEQVIEWLNSALEHEEIIGFAVGRTVFADSLTKYLNKEKTKEEAIESIAKNFEDFVLLWMEIKE